MPLEHQNTEERLARIEQMVEQYRADQRRQLLQQLAKCRRLAEAEKGCLAGEELPRAN